MERPRHVWPCYQSPKLLSNVAVSVYVMKLLPVINHQIASVIGTDTSKYADLFSLLEYHLHTIIMLYRLEILIFFL